MYCDKRHPSLWFFPRVFLSPGYSRAKCNSLDWFLLSDRGEQQSPRPMLSPGLSEDYKYKWLLQKPLHIRQEKGITFQPAVHRGSGGLSKVPRKHPDTLQQNQLSLLQLLLQWNIPTSITRGFWGESSLILQLSIIQNVRRAETQSNARVHSSWLRQEIVYKMAFWTRNYRSSAALAVRTDMLGATPVNTGLPVLHCSHSNPSPWGALLTHFLNCPSWCPAPEAGERAAGRNIAPKNLESWGQWWYQVWNSPSSVWVLPKPVSSPVCFPDMMRRQCTLWTHIMCDTMLTISPRAARPQWLWGSPGNC